MIRDLPRTEDVTMAAFVVRRLQVLARPALGNLTVDDLNRGDRWRTAFAAARKDPLDVMCLQGVEPVDLACAQAIRKLSKSRRGAGDVLDVLAILDVRRKVALYYGLPERVRGALEEHPSFGPIIAPYRDTMDEALFDLDELFAAMLDGFRAAAETGDPDHAARFLPERFRSLIPADLRVQEVAR